MISFIKLVYMYIVDSDFRTYLRYITYVNSNQNGIADFFDENSNRIKDEAIKSLSSRIDDCIDVIEKIRKLDIDKTIKDDMIKKVNQITNDLKEDHRAFSEA